MELLDEVQIRAINMANGKSLPEVPTLMFEFIGTGNLTCTFKPFILYYASMVAVLSSSSTI